jgi:GNAT superfamily N-acetyltransferase
VYKLEPLSRFHDRESFDCGNEPLNLYLKVTARQHAERGISRTFVLVPDVAAEPKTIVGYFTLNICQLLAESLPSQFAKRLPRNVSGIRLGRLAVSTAFQGKGIGQLLVGTAMEKVLRIFDSAGGIGLFVDAKDERAASYYERFGFVSLPSDPLQMFLPVETIRRAAGAS